jgi:hypothetical protein
MATGPSCGSFTLGALPLTLPEGITQFAAALNHSGRTACRVVEVVDTDSDNLDRDDGLWAWATIKMLTRRWPGINMK